MPDTVAGLFRTRAAADSALRNLKEAGFEPDQISIATHRTGRHGHYGRKVLAGIAAGILAGAIAGALVTGMVPGMKPLVTGDMLAIFLLAVVAGLATGGVAGALVSMAASGDRTLYYEQEVEAGRILVTVAGTRLNEAARLMQAAGAMETGPIESPMVRERPRVEGD